MRRPYIIFLINALLAVTPASAQLILTPDTTVCIDSGPLTLEVAVDGGIWTGNGVYDGIFYPDSAGVIAGDPGNIVVYEVDFPLTETDTAVITVYGVPVVSNEFAMGACDSNINIVYTIEFDISGGLPPYTVTGMLPESSGTLDTSGHFISDFIPTDYPYHFLVTGSDSCGETEVFGMLHTDPGCYSGTMNQTPITACAGESIIAIHNGNEFTDSNCCNLFEFIIHDGSGNYPYDALAHNSVPVFSDTGFAGFQYNTWYYISSVIGNDNGAGHVDPNSVLYTQSTGTPVVWYYGEFAEAGPDDTVCGLTYQFGASSCGEDFGYSWSQCTELNPASADYTWMPSAGDQTDNSVTVSMYGQYSFILQVTHPLNPSCTDNDTVTILFTDCGNSAGYMQEDQINIYPNPSDDRIVIGYSSGKKITWELLDISGRRLFGGFYDTSDDLEIKIDNIDSGLYYLRLFINDKGYNRMIVKSGR
ncbi:MAG: T9SS type A sorting domain-containing protein [Bacteroidetes bacterium]|nr:T9SS type A sorting domain-containing protein [Bacteroidota bacterium]